MQQNSRTLLLEGLKGFPRYDTTRDTMPYSPKQQNRGNRPISKKLKTSCVCVCCVLLFLVFSGKKMHRLRFTASLRIYCYCAYGLRYSGCLRHFQKSELNLSAISPSISSDRVYLNTDTY